MGNVVKANRKIDLLYSDGVDGDPQPYPVDIAHKRTSVLGYMKSELSQMYTDDFNFQGVFSEFEFDLAQLRDETSHIYRIEGGAIKTKDVPLNIVLG